MANRVFEDRLGLWVVDAGRGVQRRHAIRACLGGLVRDVFMPRSASADDLASMRSAGLYAHLWVAVDGRSAVALADDTLADLARMKPGALELNIELGDDVELGPYIATVIERIRRRRKSLRIRINLAPWKGFVVLFVPIASDPALYVCAQNYTGNMDGLLSPLDVAANLIDYGAPASKVTVCYAARCQVLGSELLRTLPDLSRTQRGVVFQDDLMADAGLL